GQLDDAVMHCLRAIELEPAQTLARKNLGDCYVQMERLEDAMEAYADAYELDEDNAGLCVAIGNVWLETGEPAEAASWFHRASMLEEDCIPAHCGLANIEREQNRLPEALARLQPLYEQQPENIELLLTLSDIHWDDGDAQSALNHLYTVQKLQPQRTALYAKIGHILASAGDVDGAKARYREALQQQPQCIPALSGYATTVKGKLDSAHVEQMETLLHNPKLKPGALASLHNGLAFYYDGKKDFSRAAEHMAQANRLQWQHKQIRGWEHDTVQYENHISRLIETFTPDYFQRVEGLGNNSERPVFIVAMPRSGTTLTEQILARHKNVLGIGERNFATQSLNRYTGNKAAQNISPASFNTLNGKLVQALAQDWLDRLDRLAQQSGKADIRRIVDKMPDNYSLVGWILTLLPNARIIHLKRDPRDVALSCWMTQFGAIRWACHTEHLIHRIQQYQRIMQHWREVLPGRFLEIDYELLVASQEKESRRLVDYLGLPWDENCLTFYESDRLVRTASITQVRQPVYRKSVARWKAYRELIPALFEPLS
ncbi:MAG TPA: sulfotransferase family protein, partial [Thiotrichales bacterium]|nr:sulfotransferase family protein [Thiotrichales bacterium]